MTPELAGAPPAAWQGANLSFWAITALVIVSACFATFSRRIVYAAFALFFTLVGMAGYYVLLGSGFLAITQIIIYVGGILVLLMFGILLTNAPIVREPAETKIVYVAAVTCSLLLFALLAASLWNAPWQVSPSNSEPPSEVRALGIQLLTTYVLPLEIAAMTLLLCLVGAAYLVRRRE